MPQEAGRPVAVLAALKEEAGALLRGLTPMTSPPPLFPAWHGEIEGVLAVVVLTGVGKVAAASAAQFVCDAIGPAWLLSIGLAGATTSQAARGQVVVVSAALQHDMDARPLTAARSIIPGLGIAELESDPRLSAKLVDAATKVAAGRGVVSGLVLTGDQVITSRELRDRILAEHPRGACFDMETAAIAQVAHRNAMPWAGLRITSDSADEGFDLDEVISFGAAGAAEMIAAVIHETFRNL